jgi:hypothetical protein
MVAYFQGEVCGVPVYPASVGVDVVQTPVTTPPVILGQVPFQLKKTDTVITTSLVITL